MPRPKAKAHCRSQKKAAQQDVPFSVYKHWHYNLLMTHFCHQLAQSAPRTQHMTVSHKLVFSEQPDKSCAPSVLHNQIERPAAFCRQATGQQGPDIQHNCLLASNLHLLTVNFFWVAGLASQSARQPVASQPSRHFKQTSSQFCISDIKCSAQVYIYLQQPLTFHHNHRLSLCHSSDNSYNFY